MITKKKLSKYEQGELDGQSQVMNITFGFLTEQGFSGEEIDEYWHYVMDKLDKLD